MKRNVFLSFVQEDIQLVNLFRGQVKNEDNDLEFYDYSLKEPYNSENEEYIKQQIRQKIDLVSVILCLFGRSTYKSKYVNWEIEASVRKGKGLVGVRLHSDSSDGIPSTFTNNDGILCNWNHIAVVRAIRRAAQ